MIYLRQSTASQEVVLPCFVLNVLPAIAVYGTFKRFPSNPASQLRILSQLANTLTVCMPLSELSHKVFRQLGVPVMAPLGATMRNLVVDVILLCAPVKIFNPIIRCVSVFMASLVASVWPRPNKSLKNDVMDVPASSSAEVNASSAIMFAVTLQCMRKKFSPRLCSRPFSISLCPNTSITSDTIQRVTLNDSIFNHSSVLPHTQVVCQ